MLFKNATPEYALFSDAIVYNETDAYYDTNYTIRQNNETNLAEPVVTALYNQTTVFDSGATIDQEFFFSNPGALKAWEIAKEYPLEQ